MCLGISLAIDRASVPYQLAVSSRSKGLAAEKILQAFSISKGEKKEFNMFPEKVIIFL